MMNFKIYMSAVAILLILSSCTQRAFYLNPFTTNSHPYRTIPLKSDSIRSAGYLSAVFSMGGSNEGLRDGVFAFQPSYYRAHNLKNFQAYYGAGLSLGLYDVSRYSGKTKNVDTALINRLSGNKFVGGAGIFGGANIVSSFGRTEWRVLGIEGTVQQEFGNYLGFRKKLPDTSVNAITRSKVSGTLGLYTDIIHKTRKGSAGVKFAYGTSLQRIWGNFRDYTRIPDIRTSIVPGYASFTFHVTKDQYTGFFQFNRGSYAGSLQLGMNYQLR
jgi:hypothetical protein